MITKNGLTKLLSILIIAPLLVCAGVVSCGPTMGPPPAPTPGGPPPAPPTPGGPPPGGVVAIMFVAEPDTIPQGGCTVLRWEVNALGGGRVLLDGQEVPQAGERGVCPPGTTAYQLLVEAPGGPQTREVVVNVGGGPPGPGPQPTPPGPGPQPTPPGPEPAPTGAPGGGCAGAPTFTYFTASPSTISVGQQVQLSWGPVTNGTSGPLVGSVVLSPGDFGEVGSPGSRWASPTTTTTYRLTATGCGGTGTKEVTVAVGGGGPAATATPYPSGPTATKPEAAATATSTPTRTPTPTTVGILMTVIPLVPAPTATTGSTTAAVQLTNDCGRKIESVYIRKKGESDWGNDRLAQSGPIGLGAAHDFQLAPGDYEMRALCCGGYVVSEHSATLTSGTYDWTVIAALDIHNDTGRAITEVYIVPSTQSGWGDNWLPPEPAWPGCSFIGYQWLPQGYVWRCYFSPGSYDLKAVTDGGQVYTAEQSNLQGNSAWFVKTQFWTPPAD
jgi:hypothetical protein